MINSKLFLALGLALAAGVNVASGSFLSSGGLLLRGGDGNRAAISSHLHRRDLSAICSIPVHAINSGSKSAYTTVDGIEYDADRDYDGGGDWVGDKEVDNTEDDTLYQTERLGDFTYSLAVTAGKTYRIKFHLAELRARYFEVGVRVFNIFVEGAPAFNGVDIYAEAGKKAALILEYTYLAEDDTLDIEVQSVVNRGKISALLVEEIPDCADPTTTDAPTAGPTLVPTGSPVTLELTAPPTKSPLTLSPTGSPSASPVTPNQTGAPSKSPMTPNPTANPTAKPTESSTPGSQYEEVGCSGGSPCGECQGNCKKDSHCAVRSVSSMHVFDIAEIPILTFPCSPSWMSCILCVSVSQTRRAISCAGYAPTLRKTTTSRSTAAGEPLSMELTIASIAPSTRTRW